MNPRARRILRRTFIAAFFIVAPAIILSTAGYRYNFSRQRFERTGVMLVETRPEGASVALNGEPQKPETPARLQKLSPGPYAVRVEKPGYRAWEKTVTVQSRETTFLNEISLFRETAPTMLAEAGRTSGETFSYDARYAAAFTTTRSGSELAIVDLRNGSETHPYRTSAEASALRLSWSRDGRRLLIRREGRVPEHLVWDADDPAGVRDLTDDAGFPISAAFWAQDDDRLYVASDGVLYEMNTDLALASPVGPAPAAPVVAGGDVYGIKPGEPATLVKHRLREQAYETVAELPSDDFVPLAGRGRKIAYVSTVGERLFVIDPDSGRSEAFEGRGRGGAWSADGNRLLYWNDLEVRLYDAAGGGDALITRLSGPIRQAAWHRPEWNALYASGDELFAIELADRFGRVTVPLGRFEELGAFVSSRNGDELYAFGTIDGRHGLWRLRLR
ncbi:MAG TPA: PEGA domain-containing protein [Candidatus Baltobacteraceae bacterium]|nr:PEGA domain-containing protein [Candidatus Baltobacteraceae bacterium]